MQNRSLIFPFILYTLTSGVMPVRCSGSRSADPGRAEVALPPGVAAAPTPGESSGAIVSGSVEPGFVQSTVAARIDAVAAEGAVAMANVTAIAVGEVAV